MSSALKSWRPPGPALLFCPGDRPDRFAKALARADVLIIDLEDSVLPEAKARARACAVAAAGDRVIVRVNAPETPWWREDLESLSSVGVSTIIVPKVVSPAQLDVNPSFGVIALCETARGVVCAHQIAEAPNCVALMWGAEDLAASLGGRCSRTPSGGYLDVVRHARSTVLLAARAAGLPAIDAVHVDIDDLDGLTAEADAGASSGFCAKACIHPSQVGPIRTAFAPTADQLGWARDVLAVAGSESGAFRHGTQMIDGPLLAQARSILDGATT